MPKFKEGDVVTRCYPSQSSNQQKLFTVRRYCNCAQCIAEMGRRNGADPIVLLSDAMGYPDESREDYLELWKDPDETDFQKRVRSYLDTQRR